MLRSGPYVVHMSPEERSAIFVLEHCLRRELAVLCMLEDGERMALVAADGDELVLVLAGRRAARPRLAARIDRVTLDVDRDGPVRLDHEEAVARWVSPS